MTECLRRLPEVETSDLVDLLGTDNVMTVLVLVEESEVPACVRTKAMESLRVRRQAVASLHMTPATATVVYDLGDLSSWVGAGLTLAAVVTALVIAARDRRAARREAAGRWELDQLARLAVLTSHSGIPSDSSAEMKAQEAERGAERLVLRWMLGGPDRFPIGLHADQIEVTDLSGLRQLRDDSSTPEYGRQRAQIAILAIEAAVKYRRARGGPRRD